MFNVRCKVLVEPSLLFATEADKYFHETVDASGPFTVFDICKGSEKGEIIAVVNISFLGLTIQEQVRFHESNSIHEAVTKTKEDLKECLGALEEQNEDYLETLPSWVKKELLKDEYYKE